MVGVSAGTTNLARSQRSLGTGRPQLGKGVFYPCEPDTRREGRRACRLPCTWAGRAPSSQRRSAVPCRSASLRRRSTSSSNSRTTSPPGSGSRWLHVLIFTVSMIPPELSVCHAFFRPQLGQISLGHRPLLPQTSSEYPHQKHRQILVVIEYIASHSKS